MINRILEKYDTKVEGLNNQEVEIRQKNFGPNELKEVKKDSPLKLFLSQFTDVLIFLLIIASIASYFIGDYLDSAAILAVVAINSVIGFRQEYQAEQAMEKLKNLVSTTAIVKRENKILKVDAHELTIGDIVLLEEGDKVPADLILIESHNLKIDESSLTGESLPVKKNSKYSNIENFDEKIENIKDFSRDDDIHEKLAYMDSNVVSGRGWNEYFNRKNCHTPSGKGRGNPSFQKGGPSRKNDWSHCNCCLYRSILHRLLSGNEHCPNIHDCSFIGSCGNS